MKKTSIATAEHYSWGERCDGWHLVKQPALSVIRERMPPGAAEINHFHASARQFFYILSGVAVMSLQGTDIELCTGEGLEIAPGEPHRMSNRSQADVEFLVVSQPHSHGDRHVV